ncbi:L-aspartate oxidase [Clostridium gasigenes]|uniref:L-aspartate oxidase n=1 Tax=Clostridium gasigenes TaxID=94869 RepID=A0A1H0TUS1_9CLOT|nr:L-aspartate oxidase [Clostridium gasigenes]SDP57694.1 L-aspartate oxidase [Clostridium gasigenes]
MIKNTDVLIIGTGISGLFTALNLKDNINIILVTKDRVRDCNSYLAQGGISIALNSEDIPLFINDTLTAGNYKNDISALNVLAKESSSVIQKLISFGVCFDKENNKYHYTKEGGHSCSRIMHIKDETGKAIMECLLKEVSKRKNITILENTKLLDIIDDKKCIGGLFNQNFHSIYIYSKFTIMATGGIGGLFNSSTNIESLTGDGLSIALRHNIKLKDMNYLQLHPTVLYEPTIKGRRLLLSESLRGEGGLLINTKGEHFVDPLNSRHIVSSAILKEISKTPNTPFTYLNMTIFPKEYLINRFPFLYNECLKRGYSMERDFLPVSPAHHYFMGGILVNLNSRTSLDSLYAIGEVSCTGIHGSNRLASNSLLEAIVFGNNCASDINENIIKEDFPTHVINSLNYSNEININFVNFLKRKADNRYAKLFNY